MIKYTHKASWAWKDVYNLTTLGNLVPTLQYATEFIQYLLLFIFMPNSKFFLKSGHFVHSNILRMTHELGSAELWLFLKLTLL